MKRGGRGGLRNVIVPPWPLSRRIGYGRTLTVSWRAARAPASGLRWPRRGAFELRCAARSPSLADSCNLSFSLSFYSRLNACVRGGQIFLATTWLPSLWVDRKTRRNSGIQLWSLLEWVKQWMESPSLCSRLNARVRGGQIIGNHVTCHPFLYPFLWCMRSNGQLLRQEDILEYEFDHCWSGWSGLITQWRVD